MATFRGPYGADTRDYLTTADQESGNVVAFPDDRAGVIVPSSPDSLTSGSYVGAYIEGIFDIVITDTEIVAEGDLVVVDPATQKAKPSASAASGDIQVGTCIPKGDGDGGGTGDTAGTVTCRVDLNAVKGVVTP